MTTPLHEYRFFVYGTSGTGNATFLAFDHIISVESRESPNYQKNQERVHTATMTNGDRFDLTEDQFRALMGAFRQRSAKEAERKEHKEYTS